MNVHTLLLKVVAPGGCFSGGLFGLSCFGGVASVCRVYTRRDDGCGKLGSPAALPRLVLTECVVAFVDGDGDGDFCRVFCVVGIDALMLFTREAC